jgi:peptide chain release factor 1
MTADVPKLPDGLTRKLSDLAARFVEVRAQLEDPAVLADVHKLVPLTKEAGQLESVVDKFNEYRKAQQSVGELIEMQGDPEMGEVATAELPETIATLGRLVDELRAGFVAAQDNKIDSFFLEIRAGTGGEEAALFARDLFEMYRVYCDTHGWTFAPSDYSVSERGGFKEVIINVKGTGAYRHLQFEAGGHRVQRVPETETQGRIHTSAATVAVIPELPDVKVDINPKDIEEFGCRGGGPGGQNVNKVETGWYISHKPSGLQFKMTEHKSQAQNKERAWALLRATLYERERAKQHAATVGQRKAMMGSGDRSERIRTYNFPQNRCTDHRLGGEESSAKNFNLDAVISGKIDELINALLDLDAKHRLEAL